mgnify:FL=1
MNIKRYVVVSRAKLTERSACFVSKTLSKVPIMAIICIVTM